MIDGTPHPDGRAPPPPAAERGKPTPVRVTMRNGESEAPDLRFAGRPVPMGEVEWWAQELGWVETGRREDRGVLLLLVGFRPADAAEGSFEREALLPAQRLSDVPDEILESALATAVPFQEIPEEPKAFFGPRGKPRGGGRPRPGGRGRGRRGRS